ncbi:beta-lactamase family protein [Hymenobacter sp. J193]|uniref:serine hydrolase domain-containing protein n=1 Tax=Hymenobacter sp. J193 TaxID=2898429 RepID=UPI0021518D5E|nr:serine hydrolase domain-containing protein [Hymenobacter sp. J193]MCR5888999.1 beta-lactamase family protein [Hymenobacter sp. J193]
MKTQLFGLLLLLSISGSTLAQPTVLREAKPQAVGVAPERLQRVDQLLRDFTAANYAPGAIALVAQNGKIIYHKAFGVDDVATKKPLKTDAIMRIASQTKAIASVGLMLLYDEGRFQLDDPVSKYIPAFRNPKVLTSFNEKDSTYTAAPAKQEVTIRHLLTHTSGIGYATIGSKESNAIYAKAHIPNGIGTPNGNLARSMQALGALPLMHEPGTKFTYGLNTDVVGYLVEVLSGQPLDTFLRTRLFEPLGMRDTYFYLPDNKQARLAVLYTEDDAKNTVKAPAKNGLGVNPDYPKLAGTYFSGGAGLSSTIYDYAVFLQMLLNGGEYNGRRFLKPATVQLMTTNQIGDVNQGANKFGLGFGLVTAAGARQMELAEGSYEWGGIFGTSYWVDPKARLVVLLYTQKFPNSHGELTNQFRHLVYEAVTVPKAAQPAR